MTTRVPFEWSQAIGPLLFFGVLLAALHAFAIYQLVSGKANCWPWQTKSAITRWWLYRTEQPTAFWFRIGGWSFLCMFLDALLFSVVIKVLS